MAGALLATAAAFRLPLLDRRPMHADEAIQADKFGALLSEGHYPYDPREYHGPGLAYLAWIPALLTGRTCYQTLTETTVRIAPALAGIALVFSPLLLAEQVGSTAVTWASTMLAASPIMVYYSRYFIPEMPLALWTSLFLVSLVRRWWAMAGIAAALMIATKETAVLAFAAAGMSYALVFRPRLDYRATAFLITLVVGVSILLAAPWNWGILVQSADAYWRRGIEGGGHQHPWYGYVQWLAITEAPILILAAISIRTRKPVVRFLWWYAILLAALYSAIPYKTPWCAVSMIFPMALLAGTAAESLRGGWQWAAVAFLGTAAWAASVPFATDPRNPWVYAHTGSGVFTIRDRIREVAATAPEGDNLAIDIYTRENFWPLPWYLRRFPNTRWWREVPLQGTAAPVVLVSPALEPDLTRTLYEAPPPGERELYMNLFPAYVELRPQIEVRGYVTKSLWDRK